jgi:predicted ATPase
VIRAIEIKGLRGIREGGLKDMSPLVILVGPNGCGKSSVLDALMIGGSPSPLNAIVQTVQRREGLTQGPRWLLWRAGNEGPAKVSVTEESGPVRTLQISLLTAAQPMHPFTDVMASSFSR